MNQGQNGNETNAEPPSWSLKIIGRVLEDGSDPYSSEMPYKTNFLYTKFSSFFKKIAIYLDQNLYPDNHVILWENARSPAPQDGFEVKRKGNKEFTAIIRIEMNYLILCQDGMPKVHMSRVSSYYTMPLGSNKAKKKISSPGIGQKRQPL